MALFVVDDFVPCWLSHDRSRKNADADRLDTRQGNGAGRDRMRSDGTIASARNHEACCFHRRSHACGESLRGRMLVIDIEKGNESRRG